ncbi:hypothetical protein CYLTODRAFT_411467 [Cylindrobasidium torrendii FP15055 ss-10]|uniref:Uncharacterized protein n=1 Tax=Cylindrobasidium torrendii FP15055 ss-10 TaxID=1314674 RepID=A0A0D7BA17_9AGAR|nr:hypothetical protein CYLTODRAFT_411467 [Cylindrobasidium torrendii FP15055 ss-10]
MTMGPIVRKMRPIVSRPSSELGRAKKIGHTWWIVLKLSDPVSLLVFHHDYPTLSKPPPLNPRKSSLSRCLFTLTFQKTNIGSSHSSKAGKSEEELERRKNHKLEYDPERTYTYRELLAIDFEKSIPRAPTVQDNQSVPWPLTVQDDQSPSPSAVHDNPPAPSPLTTVEGSKKRVRCDSNVGDSEPTSNEILTINSDDPPTFFPPSPKRTRMSSPSKQLQAKAPDSRDCAVVPATSPVRSISPTQAPVNQPSNTADTALDAQPQPSTSSQNTASPNQAVPAPEIKPPKNASKDEAIAYLKTVKFINQVIFGNPKSIPEIKIHCVKCDQLVWTGVKSEGEGGAKVGAKKGKRKQQDVKAKERERRIKLGEWLAHKASCVDKNNEILAELKEDNAIDKAGLGDELTPISDIRIRCVHCDTLVWEGKKEVKGSEDIQGVKGDTAVDTSKWKAHRASCRLLQSHEQPKAPSAEEATAEDPEAQKE